RKIKEKAKLLTSHLLEAAVEDIEYENGKFFVRGFPDKSKTIQDIALMANVAWNMPQGMEPGLEATTFYDPPNFVYPFGAHIAVGEAGTIVSTCTVYNAVIDALEPFAVQSIQMPLTPERVFTAMSKKGR